MIDDSSIPPAPLAADPADRAAHSFALVDTWLFSEPMADLLGAFGEQMPAAGTSWDQDAEDLASWLHLNEDLPDWLDPIFGDGTVKIDGISPEQTETLQRALAVERMAAADFDFRSQQGKEYRERSQAVAADFTPEFRERVLALTDRLGLVSPEPLRHDRYDKTLVLGGGYRSPQLRARYAAQLQAGGVDLGELSFLGSPRFLIEEPSERAVTDSYAAGAVDEFDLMVAAAQAEFALSAADVTFLCGCSSSERRCPRWNASDADAAAQTPPAYTHERRALLVDQDGRSVGSVLSASTGRPPYRPDTSDTFSLWARCAAPKLGERILVVTTQVFVPFQTFDGLRRLYLSHGIDVDTVGFGSAWGDRPQTAEYLLQETLSAIRSGRRLLVDSAAELMREPFRV